MGILYVVTEQKWEQLFFFAFAKVGKFTVVYKNQKRKVSVNFNVHLKTAPSLRAYN
jgi:hypothetical protein